MRFSKTTVLRIYEYIINNFKKINAKSTTSVCVSHDVLFVVFASYDWILGLDHGDKSM